MIRIFLMGAAILLPALLASPAPARSGDTVLYNFQGKTTDGAFPLAGLVADPNNNLFGTTAQGGPSGGSGCKSGCGIIFELAAPDYTKEKVLHFFAGGPGDGASPLGSLIVDAGENLYGTTSEGCGAGSSCSPCNGYGCGTVFELAYPYSNPPQILHSFQGGTDGQNPMAGLVMDQSGNLYGTTTDGGLVGCGYFQTGCGTVFKISAGTTTTLYAFAGSPDGEAPRASLIVDGSGDLFGTTMSGGNLSDSCVFESCGTVFELPTGTSADKLLYTFLAGKDGANPFSNLYMDSGGTISGTTLYGGSQACLGYGCGTVFQLGAKYKVIPFKPRDGGAPEAGLIRDSSGNLYSVACGDECNGGSAGKQCSKGGCHYGALYELPAGQGLQNTASLVVKYGFKGGNDGSYPAAPLLLINKVLYGTTQDGGTGKCPDHTGCGTVFSLALTQNSQMRP